MRYAMQVNFVVTAIFEHLKSITSLKVHSECRKNYTRPTSVKASSTVKEQLQQGTSRLVRSGTNQGFDIKIHCLSCGNDPSFKASTKISTKYRKVVHEVRTLQIKESIKKQALLRNDEWGQLVLLRIATVGDLVAAEAKYCHDCHVRSFTSRNVTSEKGQSGNPTKHEAFLKLCSYMENSDECQFSISELIGKIEHFLDGQDGYSAKHLLRKLDAHYCGQINISTIPGQNSVVCFSGTANKILHDSWYEIRKKDEAYERRRLVETAARIVREDVSV